MLDARGSLPAILALQFLAYMHNIVHNMATASLPHVPITERELRDHLRACLVVAAQGLDCRVVEELSIEQGSARVDLAVIGDTLEAYEIKSDLDDFGRLHNQIHAYNRVFDRITIVTGPQYVPAALELMPSWWGVIEAHRQDDGSLEFVARREAVPNLAQDARSVAMFLWRDEAIEVLESQTGASTPKRATRTQLHSWLAQSLSLAQLRRSVTRRLLDRVGTTRLRPSRPDDGLSHLDASCSGFHYLT